MEALSRTIHPYTSITKNFIGLEVCCMVIIKIEMFQKKIIKLSYFGQSAAKNNMMNP